jgi:hypothetical protein
MARQHPNVLKVRKLTRLRRAYLKGYDIASEIKVKRRISTNEIPAEHVDYFAYRRRGNTFWDPYLEAKFPSRGMVSKERQAAQFRKEELERDKVLKTLAEWSQLVLEELNVIMRRGAITKTIIRLFWDTNDKYAFFTKEDYCNMCIFKSMSYHGEGAKARAKWALNHGTIDWIERLELSGLQPDPQSG